MSTSSTEKRAVLAIADVFLSIFGPLLVTGIVLALALLLNIL